ncbi:DEAD-box ATP-dependent RNA helicase 52A-like [Penaeus japonicus]|uniref:DEAD-box ATP-dependent RNA helicase 52A-like n=1 Tax=Penaeus japonicus TaxID=27405 RepID=UPI001C70C1CC|nr:DEAD-box ATP-dependent RNA helicase 52A-like [Penaeus japonicus]
MKAVIMCCLLVAVSAGVDRRRGGGRGSNRFIPGGFGGVHGGGLFGGGIHGGGIHGGGIHGGGIHGAGIHGGGIHGAEIHGGSGIIDGAISTGPSDCRYWCKTPEGQAYCCETVYEPETPVGTKPLDCPQVRPTCPNVRSGPPKTCSNDYKCAGLDKCCFDRCLEEHVCKPPSFFNNHFPF